MPCKHTIKAGICDGCKDLRVPDILFTGIVSRWISQLIPDVQLINMNSRLPGEVCPHAAYSTFSVTLDYLLG